MTRSQTVYNKQSRPKQELVADTMSWTIDNSVNLSVTENEVRCTEDGKSKANALWSNGGTGSWEFRISGPSGIWIGVSMPAKFGPGYGMKGLFYGGPGNLSNGSSLVAGQWGPTFADGDVIGMKVEQSEDKITIAYSKNGEGLGVAFDISGWNGEEFQPAVSMDLKDQAVCIQKVPLLENTMRTFSSVGDGIEGKWEGKFKIEISNTEENCWRIASKIANSMSMKFCKKDGKMCTGEMITTEMMPPPHLYELEQLLSNTFAGLTDVRREQELLIIEGNGEKLEFSPASPSIPVTQENIRWMKNL